jgi:glycosyltransferase involved in cell wall biosynthesis
MINLENRSSTWLPEPIAAPGPLTIAIIIPTKNRPDDLIETVRSIVAQTCLPRQLIIVDQTAQSCAEAINTIVRDHPAMRTEYLWAPELPGLIDARNKGLEHATSDIVLFIDDDITLNPDCIDKLTTRYLQHPEYAGICAVDVRGATIPWWLVIARRSYMQGPFTDFRSLMNKQHKQLTEPRHVRLVSGGYMSYRRWVFDEFHFEDRLWGHRWNGSIDLSYRVSANYPVVIDPLVRVDHRKPYGTYNPEEFVRVRVAGTFFFFQRNVKKDLTGWFSFMLVIFAIFIISIRRGLQARALLRTIRAFSGELRRGLRFVRHPFPETY